MCKISLAYVLSLLLTVTIAMTRSIMLRSESIENDLYIEAGEDGGYISGNDGFSVDGETEDASGFESWGSLLEDSTAGEIWESEERESEIPLIDESSSEENSEPSREDGQQTPVGSGIKAALYIELSSHEALVESYEGLAAALSENNGITTVYFGSDITMKDGIRINPKKENVVVAGINPLNASQTQPYTLTDFSSLSFYDAIYIDAAGTKSLTVRDLIIIGKNYYGPFSILDSSLLAGIALTYERVDYNGPQLGYHRRGLIRVKDCRVRIHGDNGGSPTQEFSEAKNLVFEGKNTIDTASNLFSVFWHPLGGDFKIADDASLTLISPNTSEVYGVFYADGAAYGVSLTVGSRGALDFNIAGIVAPELNVKINSLTVREGGSFNLTVSKIADGDAFKIVGPLSIGNDAEFKINGYGGGSKSLLRQESGDISLGKDSVFHLVANSAYSSLLNLTGRAFICENPSSVLFYNVNRNISATSASRLFVEAQQINYWNKLSSGSMDDSPQYRWSKADKSNFTLEGILSAGSSGNFSSITSNYTPGEPPGEAPGNTNFNMNDARILAFGRLELFISQPTAASPFIEGFTAPGAVVRATLTQDGESYVCPDVTADSGGFFQIPAGIALSSSAVVGVKSSWRYLTAYAEAVVSGEGYLGIFAPDVMEFYNTEISANAQTVKRLNHDWKIVISDTRGQGEGWRLYARCSDITPALEGMLVFVEESGDVQPLEADVDMLIARRTADFTGDVFPVTWEENKGILLAVKPGGAFADTSYSAMISWTLIDGV